MTRQGEHGEHATKTVLVADDDQRILDLLAATLGGEGSYEIVLAREGEETLRLARSCTPNLLILDILLPNRNGYEICHELKGTPATAGIKVLILTGLSTETDRRMAMAAGADAYLVKPFSPRGLLDKIDELLN